MTAFDIGFEAREPKGGPSLGMLPDPLDYSLSIVANNQGALTLTYSTHAANGSILERDLEAEALDISILVDSGSGWQSPDRDLFMVEVIEEDVLDDMNVIKVSCRSYDALLGDIHDLRTDVLNPEGHHEAGKRPWLTVTPGLMMKTILIEAAALGMDPFTYTFNEHVDSDGQAWANVLTRHFNHGMTADVMLQHLVSSGACEYTTRGTELVLTNPPDVNTGIGPLSPDLSAQVVYDLEKHVVAAPTKQSIEGMAGRFAIAGGDGLHEEYVSATTPSPYGIKQRFQSNDSVTDPATAQVVLQATARDAGRMFAQYNRELVNPLDGSPPWPLADYPVGAWITAPTRKGQPERVKVAEITIRPGDGNLPVVGLALNDREMDAEERRARREVGIVGGSNAGGSTIRPRPEGPDKRRPAKVTGLVATSMAYIDHDGFTRGLLLAEWEPVATARPEDGGQAMEIEEYEIRVGENVTGAEWPSRIVPETSAEWGSLTPAMWYRVQVRARGTYATAPGVWSDPVVLLIEADNEPPPRPADLEGSASLGVATWTLNGLTHLGTEFPLDYSHTIVVMEGFAESGNPTTRIETLNRAGSAHLTGLKRGTVARARALAYDLSGNPKTAAEEDWTPWEEVTVRGVLDDTDFDDVMAQKDARIDDIYDWVPDQIANIDLAWVADDIEAAKQQAIDAATFTPAQQDALKAAAELAAKNYTDDRTTNITSTQIADDAITAPKLAANAVEAGKIAADAVTAGTIATDAITAREIKASEVNATHLATNSVTAVKIASDAVTAGKIDANAVTTRELVAGAVTADIIAAGAITAEKVAAKAITAEALAIAPGNAFHDPYITQGHHWSASVFTTEADLNMPGGRRLVFITTGNFAGGWYNSGHHMQVEPGAWYLVSVTMNRRGATTSTTLNPWVQTTHKDTGADLSMYGGAFSAVPANNQYVTVSAAMRIPDDSNGLATLGIFAGGSHVAGEEIWIGNIRVQRVAGATLIEDGAITTNKLTALAVSADKIATGAVKADKIEAGAVTATALHADALNFKSASGFIVQSGLFETVATANRGVKIDGRGGANRITGWNNSGQERLFFDADTGDVRLGGGTVAVAGATGNVTLGSGAILTAPVVTGGTVTGTTVQTGASGNRIVLSSDPVALQFMRNTTVRAAMAVSDSGVGITSQRHTTGLFGPDNVPITTYGYLEVGGSGFEISRYWGSDGESGWSRAGYLEFGVSDRVTRIHGNSGVQVTTSTGTVSIPSIYINTVTGTANVNVASGGLLRRISSLAADKIDTAPVAQSDAIYDLQGVTWVDRGESESGTVVGRYMGFLAEQVQEVQDRYGLEGLTVVNEDGELASVAYDRLIALVPDALRALRDRIDGLERRLEVDPRNEE